MLKENTAHHTTMYKLSYGEAVYSLQGLFASQYWKYYLYIELVGWKCVSSDIRNAFGMPEFPATSSVIVYILHDMPCPIHLVGA